MGILRGRSIKKKHMMSSKPQPEKQAPGDAAPPNSPVNNLGLVLDGGGAECDFDDRTGGSQGRRQSSRERQRRPHRGLSRGVSAAMLKQGTDEPDPGMFDRGPQTPDFQQGFSQDQPQTAGEVAVPSGAPRTHEWHVERKEAMAEACDSLGIGSGKSEFFEMPRVVGMSGPGGSGKSTLASMVIARQDVREYFYKGVLWLPVGEGAKHCLPELMLHLARMVYETVLRKACRPPRSAGVGVDPEDGAGYIHEVVNESNHRFLVVADDVREPEVLEELKWAGVWVLYTSRRDDLLTGAPLLRLDAVTKEEGGMVLRRAAGLGDDATLPPAAHELMQRCEYGAMQLAFAGRWGVVRGKSDEEAWRAALGHIAEAQKRGGNGQLLAWRDAMLRIGPDELEADSLHTKELYLSLAILPKGLAFRSKVAAVLLYGDECSADEQEAAGKALETLERLSILTLEVGGKYRVHEVHADFVRECEVTNKEEREMALARWRGYASDLRALSTYSSVWLVKIWDVIAQVEGTGPVTSPYDAALDRVDPSSPKLAKALKRAARFHWRREDRLEAYTKQYQLRLIEETAAEGPSSLAVAKTLHILGMCVYKAGRKEEAEDNYQRALAIFRERLGPDHLEVAHTMYELGRCFYTAGRTNEAEKYLRRALAIEEEKLGLHHLDVASTRYHLGVCLYRAGKMEMAKETLRPALAIWEGHPSGDGLNVAHALHSLGLCALKTGQTEEAEGLLRQSLGIREDLDPNHADVASTLHYLGACASDNRRTGDAEKLLRRALAIREEKLAPNHPDVGRTLHRLGVCVHEEAGPTKEGEELLRRALSIKEEQLGTHHPSAAKTRKFLKAYAPPPSLAERLTVPLLVAGGLLGATLLLLRSRRTGRS
ncbi:unnamed protein product [Ectocarpus sp. 4 AP-2014]